MNPSPRKTLAACGDPVCSGRCYACIDIDMAGDALDAQIEAMNRDAEPPTDAELDEWINETGGEMPEFVAECESDAQALIDDGEIVTTTTSVPYGSTTVDLPGVEFDMPEKVLRAVAFRWWENEKLRFVSEGDERVLQLTEGE